MRTPRRAYKADVTAARRYPCRNRTPKADGNGMVILSRVNVCAPPISTYQRAVKQKRRVRRAEGEERPEAELRNPRQRVEGYCGFL